MKNLLIAIDQLLNVLAGGYPDETLSARAWRWSLQGRREWPRLVIDGLFFWEPGHCEASYRSEWARRHYPSHYRRACPRTDCPHGGAQ